PPRLPTGPYGPLRSASGSVRTLERRASPGAGEAGRERRRPWRSKSRWLLSATCEILVVGRVWVARGFSSRSESGPWAPRILPLVFLGPRSSRRWVLDRMTIVVSRDRLDVH